METVPATPFEIEIELEPSPFAEDDEPSSIVVTIVEVVHHVAKYRTAKMAAAFAERIGGEGYWTYNVVQRPGGIVEFDACRTEDQDEYDHWQYWALTVGYNGSWSHPGSLDGRPAIRCM
jgi:hypothetical protein